MKINNSILYLFIFIIILVIWSEPVFASEAKIDFVEDPKYYCYKKTNAGYYYNVTVTLKNTANFSSYPIDIKLREDGRTTIWPPSCRNVIFEPKEQKNFYFDWCTVESYDSFEIVYSASNPNNISNDTSGIKKVDVGYKENNNDNNTPGFSLLILISSIIISIFLKNKYKK